MTEQGTLTVFEEKINKAFEANGIRALSGEEIRLFYRLTEQLLEANRTMNLTAVTETEDILVKHYADCAVLAGVFAENAAVADIGAGAGFPTLPLAILRRDLKLTAIDSTAKKMNYVQRTAEKLGLENVSTEAGRAEELGRDVRFREAFDAVCARAVAEMRVLAEWCLPLVKPGGLFAAMKAKTGRAEVESCRGALALLGGGEPDVREILLYNPFLSGKHPDAVQDRCLILIQKNNRTPRLYPRGNAQIRKKPLA